MTPLTCRITIMPILYSVVARGITVLAKYASCPGNFTEVTEQIIAKIPPDDSKLTYSQGSYLFHYICENRIIYMCITDDEFERSRAFLYLGEIKRRFQASYAGRSQTALAYAMNTEFSPILANEMLDELKDIMVRNIDNMAMRGERLELLVNKTENLSNNLVLYFIISMACGGLAWGSCIAHNPSPTTTPVPTTSTTTTTTALPPNL
ncbi:hypothetical protein B566_EDAN007130 [Ephemera danica]|nr:hypothetical protein B566_EDAN007130 [Ephemera danica]